MKTKTIRFPFNDKMARAIVEGRKTVMRRPMRVQPSSVKWWLHGEESTPGVGIASFRDVNGHGWVSCGPFAPPCIPGDLLIGRECWRAVDFSHHGEGRWSHGVEYRAGGFGPYRNGGEELMHERMWWCPSIHMPDWAARIRRRVVNVTVERLQDITEDEAVREGFCAQVQPKLDGMPGLGGEGSRCDCGDMDCPLSARMEFAGAWEGVYAARGLGWGVNPWVWRVEFMRGDEE